MANPRTVRRVAPFAASTLRNKGGGPGFDVPDAIRTVPQGPLRVKAVKILIRVVVFFSVTFAAASLAYATLDAKAKQHTISARDTTVELI